MLPSRPAAVVAILKTHPVNLNPPPDLPVSPHDKRWKDPAIAARVAALVYGQLRAVPPPSTASLLRGTKLPFMPADADAQTFSLPPPAAIPGHTAAFRGGAFGELFRRYSLRTASYFHAQAVSFGADAEGRWFVSARVGRLFGEAKDAVTLVVRFRVKDATVGGAVWHGVLEAQGNTRIDLSGQDETLRSRFHELTHVRAELWVDTRIK